MGSARGHVEDNVGNDSRPRNMTAMSTMENRSSEVRQNSGVEVSK